LKNSNIKNILPILGLVCVVIIWGILYYLPRHTKVSTFAKEILSLKKRADSDISEKTIVEIKKRVDSLDSLNEEQEKRIFPAKKLTGIGDYINDLGKKYNLKLLSVTPEYASLTPISVNNEEINDLPLNIEFEGLFLNFAKFLDGIPKFPYAMQIKEVRLSRASLRGSKLLIDLRCVIVLKKNLETAGSENIKKS
jgi:Tfp pilus assembly protein PilO